MRPEDQLLLALNRQVLTPEHRQTVLDLSTGNDVDWEIVYRVAEINRVSPLLAHHLESFEAPVLRIPQPVAEKLRLSLYNSVVRREMKSAKLKNAIRYFRQHGIDVMLIKGAALERLVYGQPWLVMSDDLDIVLRIERDALADSVHRQFQTYFYRSSIEFDYFAHHDVTLNGALPIDFEQIWTDSSTLTVENETVFVMSPEDMLLSLCINSCRKRYFRLKSLFDIAETIAAYPDLDWQKFVQRARAWHCNNIVYSALLVTRTTVGCLCPEEVLDMLDVGPVKATFIRYLVRALINHVPLSQLTPSSEKLLLGRTTNLSVLLPYFTYDFSQARTKLGEAYRAWRA